MTTEEKRTMVKALVANDSRATDTVCDVFLSVASDTILNRRYPLGVPEDVTEVPEAYEVTQCQLAARYFNRQGAEGEISHTENGISRTYGSVNDADLLKKIIPIGKVM